jgi:hypothetical protein
MTERGSAIVRRLVAWLIFLLAASLIGGSPR